MNKLKRYIQRNRRVLSSILRRLLVKLGFILFWNFEKMYPQAII